MATEYGKRMRLAMAHAQITQKELVRRTGLAQSTVSSALNRANGSSDTPAYAAACGVSAVWLANGEGEMIEPTAKPAIKPQTDAAAPDPGSASTSGMEIALLYDLIPISDRVRRVKAYNAATKAILAVLEEQPPNASGLDGS